MTTQALPQDFQDLTQWTEHWGHTTEAERNLARVTSEMAKIQAFYDAMSPRMEALLEFLASYGDHAPPEVNNLANLGKSFMEASLCVELFHEPTVPQGFDHRRFHIDSPA